MQIARLNGSCLFFTVVGNDELGKKSIEQLRANSVEVYAQTVDDQPTKTIAVHIDENNERTITVAGNLRPSGQDTSLPWDKLAEMDAVYFVSGDIEALKYAIRSKALTSIARVLPLIKQSNVQLDALLASERYKPGDINPEPKSVITTQGGSGGYLENGIRYRAEAVSPENIVDFYGCGDSFAAGVTYGLANREIHTALAISAHAGATAAQRRGAFGN
jgi:ribokinase